MQLGVFLVTQNSSLTRSEKVTNSAVKISYSTRVHDALWHASCSRRVHDDVRMHERDLLKDQLVAWCFRQELSQRDATQYQHVKLIGCLGFEFLGFAALTISGPPTHPQACQATSAMPPFP